MQQARFIGRLKSHTNKKPVERICNESESLRKCMFDLFIY